MLPDFLGCDAQCFFFFLLLVCRAMSHCKRSSVCFYQVTPWGGGAQKYYKLSWVIYSNHISKIMLRYTVPTWRWLKVFFAGIPRSTFDGCIIRCTNHLNDLVLIFFFFFLRTVCLICMFPSSNGIKRRALAVYRKWR